MCKLARLSIITIDSYIQSKLIQSSSKKLKKKKKRSLKPHIQIKYPIFSTNTSLTYLVNLAVQLSRGPNDDCNMFPTLKQFKPLNLTPTNLVSFTLPHLEIEYPKSNGMCLGSININ